MGTTTQVVVYQLITCLNMYTCTQLFPQPHSYRYEKMLVERLKKGVSKIANGSENHQTATNQRCVLYYFVRTNRDARVPPISYLRLWGRKRLIRPHPPTGEEGKTEESRENFSQVGTEFVQFGENNTCIRYQKKLLFSQLGITKF